MTLSKIEKCARLIGYDVDSLVDSGVWIIKQAKPLTRTGDIPLRLFNPLTNKSDLVDLMCALKISVTWSDSKYWQDWSVIAMSTTDNLIKECWVKEYGSEQEALAHAVVEVACQIYDRKFGGE